MDKDTLVGLFGIAAIILLILSAIVFSAIRDQTYVLPVVTGIWILAVLCGLAAGFVQGSRVEDDILRCREAGNIPIEVRSSVYCIEGNHD